MPCSFLVVVVTAAMFGFVDLSNIAVSFQTLSFFDLVLPF